CAISLRRLRTLEANVLNDSRRSSRQDLERALARQCRIQVAPMREENAREGRPGNGVVLGYVSGQCRKTMLTAVADVDDRDTPRVCKSDSLAVGRPGECGSVGQLRLHIGGRRDAAKPGRV